MAKIRHQRGYQLKILSCESALILHLLPFMVTTADAPSIQEIPAPAFEINPNAPLVLLVEDNYIAFKVAECVAISA